ncbi:MAG TPA: YjjW family glycine radical enzyme activase [Propionicimonas sp.]|nr:YjjW family glycine radical enzyme activase [Propionicimonas sp.]HQA78441.1 YjjW family glycine radical enzyme activase [Propionicimonas sp.]HQD98063.1 YjjW family glycine radical enzyme activase [Propionicimonas sp.]
MAELVEASGLITDFIEFSAVDGPGNRFVVFTQGCNLDCVACHNPYTINPCIDCGDCVVSCPSGALSLDIAGKVLWDADTCTGGDTCIDVCEYDSTPKARTLAVADVLTRLRPAAPFLSGVTVSGGEATQQAGFVRALFAAIKADPKLSRLTCFVDSNGDTDSGDWDNLADVMDAAMIDLKCLDDVIHRRITGSSNARVLDSIRLLASRRQLYEVRLLLLAGVNDADDLLAETGRWLASVDPRMRVKVIGYRHHGVRPSPIPLREPSAEQRAHYAEIVRAQGDFEIVVV